MRLMILLSAVSAPIAAHAQPSQDRLYGWHGGGDWGHMMFGPLMMLVFVAVVIVVVVLAVRWLGGAGQSAAVGPHPRSGKTPIVILEERFASGEIDKDEFEERRRILTG
jgi:putative membrane protein